MVYFIMYPFVQGALKKEYPIRQISVEKGLLLLKSMNACLKKWNQKHNLNFDFSGTA